MHNFHHQNLNDLIEVNAYDGVPSFVHAHRARGRKGMGLRFERKVHDHFHAAYSDLYLPSMWFSYRRFSSPRIINYAQPDAFLLDFRAGVCTIIEIKYNHTPEAYFQLLDKYLPLLDKWLHHKESGLWRFAVCEVVYWYDKFVDFPCKVSLRDDVTKVRPGEFGVHICRP